MLRLKSRVCKFFVKFMKLIGIVYISNRFIILLMVINCPPADILAESFHLLEQSNKLSRKTYFGNTRGTPVWQQIEI